MGPVKDRGAYIDKAVDDAAGPTKPAPPPPPPPPPPPKRQKSKVEQDMDDAIYGPHDDSTKSSNTGPAGQSSDAYNKY